MAAPRPTTPEEDASFTRLPLYNNRDGGIGTDNEYGFGEDGYLDNQMRQANDVAVVGRYARDMAQYAGEAVDRIEAAVEAIEDGPVSSVVGRSGIVTAEHIKTAIGFDALADDLTQKVDDALAQIPRFLPITMTVPAANATGLGAGGTYTFVVQAFAGDTVGFYPDYPVPLASRFVNVFEPGGNVPVATLPVAGTGTAFPVNFTGSGLQTSHAYDFQAGYTDAQGNSVLSQRVRATTAAQFKPSVGQAYEGGYLAYEQFGDGGLFDLVQGPKSLEASRVWAQDTSVTVPSFSRLNGPKNTSDIIAKYGTPDQSASAARYAQSAFFGTGTSYLAAIDEVRAISFKLRPANAPAGTPFVTGGSEVFSPDATAYWSSTEANASQAAGIGMVAGTVFEAYGKGSTSYVRPIKRVAVTPPIPIGTFVSAQGGWLWFYLTDLSSGSPLTYAVFKADKSVEVTRAWDTGSGVDGSYYSRTNGVTATNGMGGNARFAAAKHCFDLIHGGKDDWYLGAIDEMLAGYRMNSQLPAAHRLPANNIWTSTEVDASNAKAINPSGVEFPASKGYSDLTVIPIRRVLLSAL